MFRGIFAGDISKLSVKSCLPMDVLKIEKEYKSLMRGVIRRKEKGTTTILYLRNFNMFQHQICQDLFTKLYHFIKSPLSTPNSFNDKNITIQLMTTTLELTNLYRLKE